jgi:hypothetical protein
MRAPAPLATAVLATLLLVVAGCGGSAPTPASEATAEPQQAVSRIGDVTVRANVIQTSMLNAAVARQYGIEQADDTIMLLVGVREGEHAQQHSLPARITATATDLRGRRHSIEMRELRSGELLDYVGTVQVSLPDTLRFDLEIVREDGRRSTMQFTRDFYPR